jgi:TRAP-type C4-dicarboxylate transport system permease small subunit
MSRDFWERADRFIALFLRSGSIAMMAALVIFVAAGVIVRFLPFASMGWADEIIELAFAWLVFLGAAALRDHITSGWTSFPNWGIQKQA